MTLSQASRIDGRPPRWRVAQALQPEQGILQREVGGCSACEVGVDASGVRIEVPASRRCE